MIEEIKSSLARFDATDVIEILVITFIFYQVLLLIRGTRGWQMTLGIIALIFFYYGTRWFELGEVEWLLDRFFNYFIIALIVLYAPDMRRGLAAIGRSPLFRQLSTRKSRERFEGIVLATTTLSTEKTGGLIVLEGDIGLKNYAERGIKLDALVTYDLLLTIFNPTSPLHDGAVIVQGDRVNAAACFLPLTTDPYLSKETGSRHRAAIGITEETDAIAIVVSEETGHISAVFDGEIHRNLDGPRLLKLLHTTSEGRESRPIPQKEKRRKAV